ncbi:helix-turn-helix domain-containing protein [Sphingorhabdus sp. Alg239-R122]|uniref:helix-turn-helix domain-containing protein n=1 Tax=Sphingorhabdus sp. Alg239-R122 TaxID=2305989 RepID=UPI0013DA1BE9|nr:helix-turn-helix domain-containing protein [Sphingorhabdus sp. Alg239-R122]
MSIQKRRLDSGWSQEDLALHSGLSVRTIQRIENGNHASLESLKCLAAVFETSVSELIQEQTMTNTSIANQIDTQKTEKEAITYVQNLKAFHMNWIVFIILMPCLYILNIKLSPDFLWVIIVGLAWAFAIALHALVIFGLFSVFNGKWEQQQFQKFMSSRKN